MINFGDSVVQFKQGDRVGQMVLCPVARAELQIVDVLDQTDRGVGGFGSTGS